MNFDNRGIKIYDVSFYQSLLFDGMKILPPEKQKHIDFVRMKSNGGISAVVIRAGQYNFKDPEFDLNWKNAKEAQIPRASYWFCDARDNGQRQAKLFWSFVKDDQPEGFLAADYERGSWTNWNELYNFISELQQLSGFPNEKIFVYTGYYYWSDFSPRDKSKLEWFGKYPLWMAWYTNNPADVKIPKPWNHLTLWQDATPSEGANAGVWSKEIDRNWLNGDKSVFDKYFQSSSLIEIPTPPEPQDIAKRVTELTVNYGGMKVRYDNVK